MKSHIHILTALSAIAILVLMSACGTAKTAEQKAQEKKYEALIDSIEAMDAHAALANQHFAILADRIALGRRGLMYHNPEGSTNFVYVVDNESVVQLANDRGFYPGLNGLGGITCDGRVGKTNYYVDKKGNAHFSYNIFGRNINASVFIILFAGSNQAQADISSNQFNGKMTIYGKLVPYSGREKNNQLMFGKDN